MRTAENSKVDIAEKTDYSVYQRENCSSCQPTRMAASTKPDTSNWFDAHFTEVRKLSDSPELYKRISYRGCEELLHISDETIDFHVKNPLNDSGTDCFQLDSEEETSLDSGNGTRSEVTTDPDSEGQDEEDLEAAKGGILTVPSDDDDLFSSQNSKNEDSSADSCEMTYIELDLSSQSNLDDPSNELCMELMKMSVHSDSSKSDAKPVKVCVDDGFRPENVPDSKLDTNVERQALDFGDETKRIGGLNLIPSQRREQNNSNQNQKIPKFLPSFLPMTESNSSSLPERTYAEIAEQLLDERTPLSLSTEENCLFNRNSCSATLNTDIPRVLFEKDSSNKDLKCSFTPDETDLPNKVCPMTYVDLDVNEPCPEDITLKMLNNLNIKDDKISLRRGNPSDQNGIQTNSPCSYFDESEVSTMDPEGINTEMDFNSYFISGSSMQGFCSSHALPPSSAEFNFSSTMCLSPPFSEEMLPSETSFSKCSFLSPTANVNNHNSRENYDASFEHEFVTQNLSKLREISDLLGLSNTEGQNTIPPSPPPPPAPVHPPLSTTNSASVFESRMVMDNCIITENSFLPISQSFDSSVIPRVTTQTPGTQSDAIAATPSIYVIVTTTSRQSTFGFDNPDNSSLSEADLRKKAKEMVAKFTDDELLQFENDESCLHKAVRTNNKEYVLALLKRLRNFNSDNLDIINAKNQRSQTALYLAVQDNIPAIVHLLIKYGAEVNHLAMTPSQKLESPLHYAASQGIQFKLVLKCLLEANDLDINIKNSEGQTALHCAALAHRTGTSNTDQTIDSEYIIKKLLTCGAHAPIQDDNGKNVLMYAIESKDVNLVNHIMKSVSKDIIQDLLTATTSNGQTCLALAHSLKEQYTETQWQKLINMLTRHVSSK